MNEVDKSVFAHISWPAIFAGAVLALAVQFMLSLLGTGIGFASADIGEGFNLSAMGAGAAIWLGLTFLLSLFIGGFAASRLSGNLVKAAGTLNSLVVWALVVALNLTMAGKGAAGIAKSVGNSVGFVANSIDVDVSAKQLGGINFDEIQQEVDQFLEETDNEELKSIVKREYQDISSAAEQAGEQALQSPGSIPQVVDNFAQKAQRSLRQISQELEREDIAQALSNKTGMSQEEAQVAVKRWKERINDWSQDFEGNLQEAKREVTKQAQQAADSSAKIALYAFFTLLVGMIAAWFGGILGSRRTRKDLGV